MEERLRKKRNARVRRRSARLKKEGRCVRCGQENDTDKQRCGDCLEKQRAAHRRRTAKLKEEGRCIGCGQENTSDNVLCDSCREKRRETTRRYNTKIKEEVVEAYGGACYCCGEDAMEMLTLDHIAQDGAQHRRDEGLPTGLPTWRWAKREGFPNTLRLACYNCNASAFYNGGRCSHRSHRNPRV